MFSAIAVSVLLLVASAEEEAAQLAQKYADALKGGDQSARDMHLNGLTFMAKTISYDDVKIIGKDPPQEEKGDLAEIAKMFADIDKAGRVALDKMAAASGAQSGDEGQEIGIIDAEKAKKLMAPAQALMNNVKAKYPVMWKIARLDKNVYWHPKNPIRPLLDQTKKKGHYVVQLHRFHVESRDGKKSKKWGLKIIRFRVDNGFDTGWKILPAADWNPDE